jgi:hypothetical protein
MRTLIGEAAMINVMDTKGARVHQDDPDAEFC